MRSCSIVCVSFGAVLVRCVNSFWLSWMILMLVIVLSVAERGWLLKNASSLITVGVLIVLNVFLLCGSCMLMVFLVIRYSVWFFLLVCMSVSLVLIWCIFV